MNKEIFNKNNLLMKIVALEENAIYCECEKPFTSRGIHKYDKKGKFLQFIPLRNGECQLINGKIGHMVFIDPSDLLLDTMEEGNE